MQAVIELFAIQHSDGKRWRTIGPLGIPEFTEDKTDALICQKRAHADCFACDDPEDVRIVPFALTQDDAVPQIPTISLNGYQLKEALEFIAPNGEAEQLEQEVTLMVGDGHSGKGLYCACAEYPEEGAIILDEAPATQTPSEMPQAASGDVVTQWQPSAKNESR